MSCSCAMTCPRSASPCRPLKNVETAITGFEHGTSRCEALGLDNEHSVRHDKERLNGHHQHLLCPQSWLFTVLVAYQCIATWLLLNSAVTWIYCNSMRWGGWSFSLLVGMCTNAIKSIGIQIHMGLLKIL